ncbi:hypothetical protein [Bacteroides faecichinchillae]|nr:hypothetical protein [Bacteroides faecichinchillae]
MTIVLELGTGMNYTTEVLHVNQLVVMILTNIVSIGLSAVILTFG